MNKIAQERLTTAILADDGAAVEAAIRAGADPLGEIELSDPASARQSMKNLAWFCAAMIGATNAMGAMLAAGVPLETERQNTGCRAVHYAAIWSQFKSVEFLLVHGADPHARNLDGDKPLSLVRRSRFRTKEETAALSDLLRAATGARPRRKVRTQGSTTATLR